MGNEMFNDEQLAYLKDQAKAADLAAARRRAEGSLANVERERLVSHIREAAKFATRSERMIFLHDYDAKALVAVIDALRSLLAATPEPAAPRNGMDWSGTTGTVGPEPAPALPDEVREAAEMLALTLKMREAKHACNDATCRNVERAGWNVLAALAARKHR